MRSRLLPPRTEGFFAGAFESGGVLAMAVLVAPTLAVFAPHGLAPLLALSASVVVIRDGWRSLAGVRGTLWLVVLLGALSLWCLASAIWSILPQHSLVMALRLVLTSVAGIVVLAKARSLGRGQRERVRQAAILGLAVAVALMLIERFTGAALTRLIVAVPSGTELSLARFDRGAVCVVLSLWPVLAAQRRAWVALAVAVATAVAVMTMASSAAKVALPVSIVAAAIAWRAPRLLAAALGGGLVLLAVVLPLAVPDARAVIAFHEEVPWIKVSGIHRLLIWRFTADRIAERPILGWGMDASRALPGGHLNLGQAFPAAGLGTNAEALPLHPHNALLQLQVELGVPGTALALAIVLGVLWKLARQESLSSRDRAGTLGLAAAALVIAMLSYGLWQEWWLACLWLASASYAAALAGDAGEYPSLRNVKDPDP